MGPRDPKKNEGTGRGRRQGEVPSETSNLERKTHRTLYVEDARQRRVDSDHHDLFMTDETYGISGEVRVVTTT